MQVDGSEMLQFQDKNNLTGSPARNLPFNPCRSSPAGSDILQAQGADPICTIAQSIDGAAIREGVRRHGTHTQEAPGTLSRPQTPNQEAAC